MGWIVAGTLLGGAIGARVSTLWGYVDTAADPSLVGALADGGKSILGGLSGAYVGALVAKRILGYRRSTGDLFAPAVALGMAVGRVGCFLTEQVGTPTSMPWGIHVSPEAAARIPHCPWCLSGVAMHPSMLYEIAFHLVAFARGPPPAGPPGHGGRRLQALPARLRPLPVLGRVRAGRRPGAWPGSPAPSCS